MQIRLAVLACAVLVTALTTRLTVQAQTVTPTLTPVPTPTCTPRSAPPACLGAKLQVAWFVKDPTMARISISATGCPLVQSCLAGVANGDLVSVPPLTVTITDADNNVLGEQVTAPGRNVGGCPGGSDTYRGVGRLRLVYGAAMSLIATLRVPLVSPTPPTLTPPVTVTVRDACGSILHATTTSCFVKASSVVTATKCILSAAS